MKIESRDRTIEQLLRENNFVIPRFQRPYSWESEHISAFWEDILTNMDQPYFIGSMVVYRNGRDSVSVVDGQQRLTTITILLCTIREAFRELDQHDLADGLQGYIEKKDRDFKTVYILKTETSFPFLQEEVLKDGPSLVDGPIAKEEESILKAYTTFKENIQNEVGELLKNRENTPEVNLKNAVSWLTSVRDAVFNLNTIVVSLENEQDAYLIFETLNTRGKDLALSDLLRNHFSRYVRPKNEVDYAKVKWTKVLDIIESSPVQLEPDNFIVHSWQSRYDYVTKAKTFPKVKELVNKDTAHSHLDRFVSDAEYWRSIFDTEYGWSKAERDVARSLEALRIFKVVQPTPGLLSLIRAYRDGIIRYPILRRAVQDIEKFHFSFNAITSSRSSGGISSMYSSLGRQIYAADDSNDIGRIVTSFREKLRDREVPDKEFDAGFEQVILTKRHSKQKALVRYILKGIAGFEGQPVRGEVDDLTIEHLLPQSSSPDGESDHIIGQIGNLVLVDAETNNLLSTNDFENKKNILLSRGYKLPQILIEADNLSPELISENTMRVAEIARDEVWKV